MSEILDQALVKDKLSKIVQSVFANTEISSVAHLAQLHAVRDGIYEAFDSGLSSSMVAKMMTVAGSDNVSYGDVVKKLQRNNYSDLGF